MYSVAHRNGQGGIYSDYYIDEHNIPTLEEAKEKSRLYREENPASDGWRAIVSVLDETGTPIYSPR